MPLAAPVEILHHLLLLYLLKFLQLYFHKKNQEVEGVIEGKTWIVVVAAESVGIVA